MQPRTGRELAWPCMGHVFGELATVYRPTSAAATSFLPRHCLSNHGLHVSGPHTRAPVGANVCRPQNWHSRWYIGSITAVATLLFRGKICATTDCMRVGLICTYWPSEELGEGKLSVKRAERPRSDCELTGHSKIMWEIGRATPVRTAS